MHRRLTAFLFSIFICISINAQQIYYIDPNGNDSTGDGSSTAPWKTLNKACRNATSGSTIHVNPGTYYENVACNLPVGVSIEGEGASTIITSSTLTAQHASIINAHAAEGTSGNQSISNLVFDGNNETIAQAFTIMGRSNFSIHDCTFRNFRYMAIHWGGRSDTQDAPPTIFATGNSFYNNIVTNCAGFADGYARGALMIGGQDGMLIYDNTITQIGREGGTNGWPIKAWINNGYIKGVKIYNNTLFKDDLTHWDFCIEMNNVIGGVEIYDNVINGSIDSNHQSKGSYPYSIYIHDNTIGPETPQRHAYYGMIFEFDTEGIIIARNNIRNVGLGVMYSCRNGTVISDNQVYYNTFTNIGQINGRGFYGCIRFIHDGSNNYYIRNYDVFNNVFQGSTENNPVVGFEMCFNMTSASNVNIINNIFVNFTQNWFWTTRGSVINGLRIENNLAYNNGNRNAVAISGTPTNYIFNNNHIENPLFISYEDLHLQETSPIQGMGLNVMETLTNSTFLPDAWIDMEGVVASSSSVNIGAFNTAGSDIIPKVKSAIINDNTPSTIQVSFNTPLNNILPEVSAFEVKINNTKTDITSATISGNTLMLELAATAYADNLVTLSYTKPDTLQLQSETGKPAMSFVNHNVINDVEPNLTNIILNNGSPSFVRIIYDVAIAKVYPDKSAFKVKINGSDVELLSVTVSNNIVLVRMTKDATADDEITISYTKPTEKPIQTLGGKVVPSIPTTAVVNNTLPKIKTSLISDQNQSLVTLNFDTELANIIPDISAFNVKINSSVVNIKDFNLSRNVITMALSKSAFANDTVKISYTRPTTNRLQSPKGKQVDNLVDYVVTNEVTPKPARSVINDGTPNYIRVVFDAAMAKIYPPISSFTVTRNGKKDNILSFNTSGTVLYLRMAEDIYADDEITVSYIKSGTKPLQSLSGNEANSFSNIVSTNNTTPKIKRAIINNDDPSLITMEFTSILKESSMPDISAFNVKINGGTVIDPDIRIKENSLFIKISDDFQKNDNVKVSYTKPTENELQSPKGSLVASFTDYQVINNLYQLDTLDASMTLYPNPANEHFYIKLEANDKLPAIVNCRIIDISGKVLYSTKISTESPQSMSLSNITKSGIYIIQLYIEKTILASEKLIVTKTP